MTLKQAWESWRMIPKNMTLATKSRSVFNDVLLSMYGGTDLKEFTISFVRDIFYSNLAAQGDKVKAASILVYLLEWGAEQGYCEPPSFDETIVEMTSTSVLSEQEEQQQVFPVASVPISSKEEVKEEKPKKHAGRAMRKVVQLHPDTLEVIKVWDSMREATVALGVKNFDRAIRKHFKAAGYYWCNPGEEESFKAARQRKTPSNKEHVRNPLTLVPREETSMDDTPDIKYELTREELLEFAKLATYHLDDRLCPLSREELRAEAWLQGYEFVKSHTSKSAAHS